LFEIADIKVLNSQEESQTMEEMLIKSGFNMQMEQLINMVPPFSHVMSDPPTPKEMECLGFKFAEFDVIFKKGFVELNTSYKKVEEPSDPEVCRGFLDALRQGPQ